MYKKYSLDTKENCQSGKTTKWFVLLGWVALAIFTLQIFMEPTDVGDTWIALACGRYHIHHGVNTVDPFSGKSISAGPTNEEVKLWPAWSRRVVRLVGLDAVKRWHPTGWVNQNWLSHLFFYWLITTFGSETTPCFNSLLWLKYFIYAAAVLLIYQICRKLGARPIVTVWSTFLALLVGKTTTGLRPTDLSHLMVTVFMLILVVTTYRHILYVWFIVPLAVLWGNLHGGYIYIYVMLVPFILIHMLSIPFKNIFVTIGWRGVVHTALASVFSLVMMILFNPFHLTNVTHIYVISLSKAAPLWRRINEWRAIYDTSLPCPEARLFLVMVAILFVLLMLWLTVYWILPIVRSNNNEKLECKHYKFDLALLIIVIFSVVMAIRSRRFITIAAFVAGPLIAMYIEQLIEPIHQLYLNYKRVSNQILSLFRFHDFAWAVIVFVVFMAVGTIYTYYYSYASASPVFWKNYSMFDRILASYTQPKDACTFLNLNSIRGQMINAWTEGGFITWSQLPDQKTGASPLKLFIDGRAQAAYSAKAYNDWLDIWYCRPILGKRNIKNDTLSDVEWENMSNWLDKRLKKEGVQIALLPFFSDNAGIIHRALKEHRDWKTVYLDDKFRILVDITTKEGQRVIMKIKEGEIKYPNEFIKTVNKGRYYLKDVSDYEKHYEGLSLVEKALLEKPSLFTAQQITQVASANKELRPQIIAFCKNWLEKYYQKKHDYEGRLGFAMYLDAVREVEQYLDNNKERIELSNDTIRDHKTME